MPRPVIALPPSFAMVAIALLFCIPSLDAKKEKKPKPPTQEDIVNGCVTVSHITSHSLSLFSGVGAPVPGLEAVVFNGCDKAIHLTLTIAYLDGRGVQFGSGTESQTVATQTNWQFYHQAQLYGLDQGRMKLAKIIEVKGY
jgi:hypothetical protein